jgi:type I restriction enzyme S subunit
MANRKAQQKIPRGYKETKSGVIPIEWDYVRIDHVASVNPRRNSCKDNDLEVSFVPMSYVSVEGRIEQTDIKKYLEVSNGYTYFENDDILVAKITPCFESGKGALAKNLKNGIGFGSTEFHILRAKKQVDRKYLFYHTMTASFRKRGERNMTGTAGQKRVPTDFILTYHIPLPPIHEQKKIAAIISVWDKTITKTHKLILAKRKFKKALMQQLLTGKYRFKEFKDQKWKTVALKAFLVPRIRPIPKPSTAFTALGIRSFGNGTFQKPNFEPSDIALQELYQVRKDDLIVNITFAWEGAIAIADESDDGALVSHRFPTYKFNREVVIPDYFRHVILQKHFVHELGLVSPGGAGRNRVMSKTDFLKIKVTIPPMEEQYKIGGLLNTLDNEVKLLSQHLYLLKQQKRGLMQKLLTGKIRVKV